MKKLKELRSQKGYSQKKVAEVLGITQQAYANYERGVREPDYAMLKNLADFFDVSVDYLLGRSPLKKDYTPNITEDFVSFPVIGEVAAGYDHIAVEDWTGDTIELARSMLHGREPSEFFVLRVTGDSMYPDYRDGDKVLVLRQETLNYSGQVGVIIYDTENASLKKVEFVKGENWLRMVAINPNFPPHTVRDADLTKCRIIGIPQILVRDVSE